MSGLVIYGAWGRGKGRGEERKETSLLSRGMLGTVNFPHWRIEGLCLRQPGLFFLNLRSLKFLTQSSFLFLSVSAACMIYRESTVPPPLQQLFFRHCSIRTICLFLPLSLSLSPLHPPPLLLLLLHSSSSSSSSFGRKCRHKVEKKKRRKNNRDQRNYS